MALLPRAFPGVKDQTVRALWPDPSLSSNPDSGMCATPHGGKHEVPCLVGGPSFCLISQTELAFFVKDFLKYRLTPKKGVTHVSPKAHVAEV